MSELLTKEERDAMRADYLSGPIRASGVSRFVIRLLDDLDAKDAEIDQFKTNLGSAVRECLGMRCERDQFDQWNRETNAKLRQAEAELERLRAAVLSVIEIDRLSGGCPETETRIIALRDGDSVLGKHVAVAAAALVHIREGGMSNAQRLRDCLRDAGYIKAKESDDVR